MEKYDYVIIGAGTTGLSSAIYAARFRLKCIVIGETIGGTIASTDKVENWPGIPEISGWDLAEKMKAHAKANNVEIINARVSGVEKKGSSFLVSAAGKGYTAKSILFATGSARRKLGVPGEKEFENKGVSYCAVCDGALFKGKTVAVIGGSDSAVKEAIYLAEHASKVYVIYRGNELRAEPVNMERLERNAKIEVLYGKNVSEVFGETMVKGVKFREGGELALGGVFVEIGAVPNSGLAKGLGVKLNESGEIIIDDSSRTNVKGIFAAGDVCNRKFKQAITGSAEGVAAAFSAYEFVGGKS